MVDNRTFAAGYASYQSTPRVDSPSYECWMTIVPLSQRFTDDGTSHRECTQCAINYCQPDQAVVSPYSLYPLLVVEDRKTGTPSGLTAYGMQQARARSLSPSTIKCLSSIKSSEVSSTSLKSSSIDIIYGQGPSQMHSSIEQEWWIVVLKQEGTSSC